MATSKAQAQWFKDLPLEERVKRYNDFMVKEGLFQRANGKLEMVMSTPYPASYYMDRWQAHIAPVKKSKEKPKK
jgi:hypothetical protein